MSTCDNKSVGVIIRSRDTFAVIKRKNYPIAYAFVAGHLDGMTPEEAAQTEAQEESNISIHSLKEVLHKRLENPCKREGGSWHEWFVYEAIDWSGTLSAGSDAKEASWKSQDDLRALAKRTHFFSKKLNIPLSDVATLTEEVVNDPDWQKEPGLEPVWVILLEKLALI